MHPQTYIQKQNNIDPQLEEYPNQIYCLLVQQDGCPVHFSRDIKLYLDRVLRILGLVEEVHLIGERVRRMKALRFLFTALPEGGKL